MIISYLTFTEKTFRRLVTKLQPPCESFVVVTGKLNCYSEEATDLHKCSIYCNICMVKTIIHCVCLFIIFKSSVFISLWRLIIIVIIFVNIIYNGLCHNQTSLAKLLFTNYMAIHYISFICFHWNLFIR